MGLAVDLNHRHAFDTQEAALLSLATILEPPRAARAADELIRVAQQHADDVTLAHATAYCSESDGARASAAALHLPHVVAYCDMGREKKQHFTGGPTCTLPSLAHAVRLAPHPSVDALYATIPRAQCLHGTEHALALALDRMHATAALLGGEDHHTSSCYIVLQATAALALADDVACIDVAYARLTTNAMQWDLAVARRILDKAASRLPYDTGPVLASARQAVEFAAALGAHDWRTADGLVADNATQRALLHAARGEFTHALQHADASLTAARVLLEAGDWSTALHRALEALLHTADAEAAVLLAEALMAGGFSRAYAQQLLWDAVPVLVATRRAWPLAKAHSLLAVLDDRCWHLERAAVLFAQVGALVDAATMWQVLAVRSDDDKGRRAYAAKARECLMCVHADYY